MTPSNSTANTFTPAHLAALAAWTTATGCRAEVERTDAGDEYAGIRRGQRSEDQLQLVPRGPRFDVLECHRWTLMDTFPSLEAALQAMVPTPEAATPLSPAAQAAAAAAVEADRRARKRESLARSLRRAEAKATAKAAV